MQLRTIPIAELKPAPYNPRKPLKRGSAAWKRLERSLTEFDLVQPIVWNEATGHVVGGHQRLAILQSRGIETVEVAVVNLPLPREKALNVALNNAQVGSEWDAAKLLDLVTELSALPDFDATLTGFDEADLHDLLLEPDPFLEREDAATKGPKQVQVTLLIPSEDWQAFRPALDDFLAEHPQKVHVQLPK